MTIINIKNKPLQLLVGTITFLSAIGLFGLVSYGVGLLVGPLSPGVKGVGETLILGLVTIIAGGAMVFVIYTIAHAIGEAFFDP